MFCMLVYHTRSCVHIQTFVGYNRSKAMLGVSARDFVTVAHYRVLPDGRIAVFATHSVHPACPEVKGGYGGLCVCTHVCTMLTSHLLLCEVASLRPRGFASVCRCVITFASITGLRPPHFHPHLHTCTLEQAGVVRGKMDAGGVLLTPSPDGHSCECIYLLRTNLAGQLPSMVVQAALAMQCLTVANITKVRAHTSTLHPCLGRLNKGLSLTLAPVKGCH